MHVGEAARMATVNVGITSTAPSGRFIQSSLEPFYRLSKSYPTSTVGDRIVPIDSLRS